MLVVIPLDDVVALFIYKTAQQLRQVDHALVEELLLAVLDGGLRALRDEVFHGLVQTVRERRVGLAELVDLHIDGRGQGRHRRGRVTDERLEISQIASLTVDRT